MTEIELGNKTVKLNSSAATPLLYKQLFKEDFIRTQQNIRTKKEKLNKRLKAITTGSESPEELQAIVSSDAEYLDIVLDLNDTVEPMVQQLTYIMYLEGTYSIDEIYKRLDQKSYIEFLLSVGPLTFKEKASDILAVYNANNGTDSTSKKN